MKNEFDAEWMQEVWQGLLLYLPASVTVNLDRKCCFIRDNTLTCIFGGDMDAAGVESMIRECAEHLLPEDRGGFSEALSVDRLSREWKGGRHGYSIVSRLEGNNGEILKTDVLFGQRVEDMIVEFRFGRAEPLCAEREMLGK